MKKPWCIEPFISVNHNTEGFYQLCCVAKPNRSPGHSTYELTPSDYFNSDYMKQIRNDMATGNITDEILDKCEYCILNEEKGHPSRRLTSNQKFYNGEYKDNTVRTMKKYYKDPFADLDLESLEYVNLKILGNICNLKCIMCNQNSSSKIAAEFKKTGFRKIEKVIQVPFDDGNADEYLESIREILNHVSRFSLIGGEAFINPNFNKIFDTIMKSENLKNLELFVITNGTDIPDYVLESTKHFKNIKFVFSVDGVEEKGEYIRSDLVWEEFDENVKKTLESDVDVGFTIAVQMLNVGYLDQIYYYVDGLSPARKLVNTIGWGNWVNSPEVFRPVNLPVWIRKTYNTKYKDTVIYDSNMNHHFQNVINFLNSKETDGVNFLKFINYMKFLDKTRNRNLLDVFPEFEMYYL